MEWILSASKWLEDEARVWRWVRDTQVTGPIPTIALKCTLCCSAHSATYYSRPSYYLRMIDTPQRLGWLVLALCIMWAVLSKTLLLLQSTCWSDFGKKAPQNWIWGARKWGLVPQGVNMTWNECHPVVGSKSKHTSFVLTVCQWQNPFNVYHKLSFQCTKIDLWLS